MATVYLDTSAVGRLLLGESDAPAILRALGAFEQLVASRLMRIELRRLAMRTGRVVEADQLLAGVAFIPLDGDILAAAETIPPVTVATLDAVHLASAVRLSRAGRLDAVMTYDARLADGAREHGLSVVSPA